MLKNAKKLLMLPMCTEAKGVHRGRGDRDPPMSGSGKHKFASGPLSLAGGLPTGFQREACRLPVGSFTLSVRRSFKCKFKWNFNPVLRTQLDTLWRSLWCVSSSSRPLRGALLAGDCSIVVYFLGSTDPVSGLLHRKNSGKIERTLLFLWKNSWEL